MIYNDFKIKKNLLLYYIPFILFSFLSLVGASMLIEINPEVKMILYFIIIFLFIFKIILDKITINELFCLVPMLLITAYSYIKIGDAYFFVSIFAIFALKKIDIKKIVKIDIIIKFIVLFFHVSSYVIDYIFNYNKIQNLFFYRGSIIRQSLYFTHPNLASSIFFWLIMDIMYLKKNITFKENILNIAILYIVNKLTGTRLILYLYIIYLLLNVLEKIISKKANQNIIDKIYKYIFEFFTIISIGMSFLYIDGMEFIRKTFNSFTSGRAYFSGLAVKRIGVHLLSDPKLLSYSDLIIDNFYVRSYVCFGLIYVIALIILTKLNLGEEKNLKEKILIIILAINLFSDYNVINVGNAMPLLLICNIILNRNKKREKKFEK